MYPIFCLLLWKFLTGLCDTQFFPALNLTESCASFNPWHPGLKQETWTYFYPLVSKDLKGIPRKRNFSFFRKCLIFFLLPAQMVEELNLWEQLASIILFN